MDYRAEEPFGNYSKLCRFSGHRKEEHSFGCEFPELGTAER